MTDPLKSATNFASVETRVHGLVARGTPGERAARKLRPGASRGGDGALGVR